MSFKDSYSQITKLNTNGIHTYSRGKFRMEMILMKEALFDLIKKAH